MAAKSIANRKAPRLQSVSSPASPHVFDASECKQLVYELEAQIAGARALLPDDENSWHVRFLLDHATTLLADIEDRIELVREPNHG